MQPQQWPRFLALALGLAVFSASATSGIEPPTDSRSWHRTIGLLQYLQSDYPEAARTQNPSELQEQRALLQEVREAWGALGPAAAPLQAELDRVGQEIDRGGDPEGVRRGLGELVEKLSAAGNLSRRPRTIPNLEVGAQVFQSSCAACHGATGRGDGPAAAALTPRPADFHSGKAKEMTPYQVYNTVDFGIPGTAMAAISGLNEDQKWAVAFYVGALRQPPCRAPGQGKTASLELLANQTDADLARHFGADAVACLRSQLEPPATNEGLQVARAHVERARTLAAAHDRIGARQAVVDAYLEGIEPIEPRLRAKAPNEVARVEEAFLKTRLAAERDEKELQREAAGLLKTFDALEQADRPTHAAARFTSVFWMALLVVVREGFEATLVVAALLAVLRKLGQSAHARVVHVGWTSALLAGAVAFVVGQRLLAGANREWMEGVVALLAVAMLLYAAFWLNARSHVSRYMGELRARTAGALGRGSALGLFFIAFSAAFRECFETALFLEGLALDSALGVAWGGLAGLGVMAGLVLFIWRVGYRLPMKPLFKASTVLLMFTATVMLGKGIHALQEVGALPFHPIRFFAFDPFGIFPDAFSLAAQAGLVTAAVAFNRVMSGPSVRGTPSGLPTPGTGPDLPAGGAGSAR